MKNLLSVFVFFISIVTYSQNVNIPDANFKFALLNHTPPIDLNNDNEIQISEAHTFSDYLDVSESEIYSS